MTGDPLSDALAEIARLQALNVGLVARVAAQSELLTRCAGQRWRTVVARCLQLLEQTGSADPIHLERVIADLRELLEPKAPESP